MNLLKRSGSKRRSLDEQHDIVFDILSVQKPEWCLYLDLTFVEDGVKKLPFYNTVWRIVEFDNFFIKKNLICRVVGPRKRNIPYNLEYYVDLFCIKVWKIIEIPCIAPKVSETLINPGDVMFEDLFTKLLKYGQIDTYGLFKGFSYDVLNRIYFDF